MGEENDEPAGEVQCTAGGLALSIIPGKRAEVLRYSWEKIRRKSQP